MTELLLHIAEPSQGEFTKFAPSLYYQHHTKTFYRLSFLPHTVIFQNQQVSQPHLASFTKYDPYFYAINLLLKKSIPLEQLPEMLRSLDFDRIADLRKQGSEEVYHINREKIFDFLQKKVEKLQRCFKEKLGEKSLQVSQDMQAQKQIKDESLLILKSEIQDKSLIDAFAKERYGYHQVYKFMPYPNQQPEEAVRKKIVKKQPKKEEKRLQVGQKTLAGFFGKK